MEATYIRDGVWQIGNYVVFQLAVVQGWGVRMAGDEEYISTHPTRHAAELAVTRYQAADKRRAA